MKSKNTPRVGKREFPGFTLIKKDDHYQLRRIGLSARRVRFDPAFVNTRLLAQEFSRALQLANKWVPHFMPPVRMKSPVRTLAGALMHCKQADQHHPPGLRNILQGNMEDLQGLELNRPHTWQQAMKVDCTMEWKGEEGLCIGWPAIIPALHTLPPPGATHLRLMTKVIAIDHQHNCSSTAWQQSSLMPIKHIVIPANGKRIHIGSGRQEGLLILVFVLWYTQKRELGQVLWNKQAGPLCIKKVYRVEC